MSLAQNMSVMKNCLAVALLEMEPHIDRTCAAQGLDFSGRETLAWITTPEGVRCRVSVLVESQEVADSYND